MKLNSFDFSRLKIVVLLAHIGEIVGAFSSAGKGASGDVVQARMHTLFSQRLTTLFKIVCAIN